MAGTISPESYKEALVFLGTAGLVVPVFHRLRISPVIGFLIAGIAVGPYGLHRLFPADSWVSAFTLSDAERVAPLAELGVVFLLFMIGLELSWQRLKLMRQRIFGLGSLQLLSAMATIAVVAYALGQTTVSAVVIGGALAMSSTAIVMPTLAARRRLASPVGRASFAVLLFQDLAVAPLLLMVAALDDRAGGGLWTILYALGRAAVVLLVLVAGGRLLLRPVMRYVAGTRSPELFMAVCLLVVVGTGLMASLAGLSMALGAFVAGLLLAETEFRREVEVMIDPFKGLLLGLFFVTMGAGLNVPLIVERPLVVGAIAVGLIMLKVALLYPIGRALGLPGAVSRDVSLLLGPAGEFAFVLLPAAVTAELLPGTVAQHVIAGAMLSMMALPLIAGVILARRTVTRIAAVGTIEMPPEDAQARVIVVGYGRVGALIGDMLTRHEIPYIAIDTDPDVVARARDGKKPIYYGDASRIAFLRRCGLAYARAIVVTTDDSEAAEHIVRAVRKERPDLTVVARARDARHAGKLYALGVTDAVPETVEASLQLSEALLVDIGVPMGLVIASIHERRDEYRQELSATGVSPPRALRPGRRLRQRRETE
ncbi:MAG: cation:proton antiporter [Reyranellaceae bacterium]